MKQFSLEEYLKNPSKKVVTRDGRNVKIHCTNYNGNQPIIAEVEDTDYSTSFYLNGRFLSNEKSMNDLFFAPEKHEGWVNIYPDSVIGHELHMSEEEAKKLADSDVIATVKIEWDE